MGMDFPTNAINTFKNLFSNFREQKEGKSHSQIKGIEPQTLPEVLNGSIPLKLVRGFMAGLLIHLKVYYKYGR